MKRWDVINCLVKKNKYKSYLEIGYGNGETFHQINIEKKTGVDIKGSAEYVMSSEDFLSFAKKEDFSYDIIFIDGNHNYGFAKKDVQQSLDILNEGGTIVMHDCNPVTEKMQRTDILVTDFWTGDVWKVFAELRILRDNLEMYVVDTDYGCGVIQFGQQEKYNANIEDLTYAYFDKNKKDLMNLVPVEKFKDLC